MSKKEKTKLTPKEKELQRLWFAYIINECRNSRILTDKAIVKLVHSCDGHMPRPITLKDVERVLEDAWNVVKDNHLA